jgi:hypothetical protein
MKKIFTLFAILAVVMLTPSCQNELLDALSEYIACKSGTGQTGASPEILLGNTAWRYQQRMAARRSISVILISNRL